jgi:hypothetical protein
MTSRSLIGGLGQTLNTRLPLAHRPKSSEHAVGSPCTLYVALQGNDDARPDSPSAECAIEVEIVVGVVRVTKRWPMRAVGLRLDFVCTELTATAVRIGTNEALDIQLAGGIVDGPQPRPEWAIDDPDGGDDAPVIVDIPPFVHRICGPLVVGGAAATPTFYGLGGAIATSVPFELTPNPVPFPADATQVALDTALPIWFQ